MYSLFILNETFTNGYRAALFTFLGIRMWFSSLNAKNLGTNVITFISEKKIFNLNTFNNYRYAGKGNTFDILLLTTSIRSWGDILILFICIIVFVYIIRDFLSYVNFLFDISLGRVSLYVLFSMYIFDCFKDCIYYLLEFSIHYRVCCVLIKENGIKALPIVIYIYYSLMDFIKNCWSSLVFLYIFCIIVAYCFPLFLGVLYVLSSIFLLFSSILLFTYINFINLDFKNKHTYFYYLLSGLSIILIAFSLLFAKHAIYHLHLSYIQMCKGNSGDKPTSNDNGSHNNGSQNNGGPNNEKANYCGSNNDKNDNKGKKKEYISTGPNEYVKEKEEYNKLQERFEPSLDLLISPEPNEYLNDIKIGLEKVNKPGISWLEKVKSYFDAKDAGREASTEDVNAFDKRKERYLGHAANENWKGPHVNFNDPSNVRKVAEKDLQELKISKEKSENIVKGLEKENFTAPDAKANFYKRLDEILAEHHSKHDELYKKKDIRDKAFIDSWSKETLDYMIRGMRESREKLEQDIKKRLKDNINT